MNTTVKEYRVPLMIGAGALVVALLIWAVLVSPQNSKLSSLKAQEATLQTQQSTLEVKLASLKTEQQQLSSNCADLQKIATEIPSVQSPTDIDAEESSFESQFNALASGAGVTLTQFSGFAGATGSSGTTTPTTTASTSGSTATATDGVVAVPTTLAVTGNYSQMTSFIKGLDSFPRLFVIQTFVLALGSTSPNASSSSSSAATAAGTATTPLWVGGTSTGASAGPYSLGITGSIYYTSTPNALDTCTKAAAAVK